MEKPAEELANSKERVLSGRAQLEREVRERAWKDETFRQEFLTNAKAVLERDYGQWFPDGNIPSGISIRVLEEEEQSVCFVLPPKSPDQLPEVGALDEEQLAAIAGGIDTVGCDTDGCNATIRKTDVCHDKSLGTQFRRLTRFIR